jgi:DNA primase
MAKTYVDTVKYLVRAKFEVGGIVEKPDIVGAIFGQTEGLLGDELDLRELQNNGRIGRIEVISQIRGGRSYGAIEMPSSLDMAETSILAAALETVDRIGPCEARISVERIEDTRNIKRKQVLERAKNLLKSMLYTEIPESKQLTELVREEVKVAEITAYGPDRVPAGPEVAPSEEVIFVEGRADVLNLLKNGIKNTVAVGGAAGQMSRSIIQLAKEKEVTVFLDGDRGGDIILKELMNACDIDYVSRAPPGREVEELARKEIIKCLRRRVPVEQVEGYRRRRGEPEGPETAPAMETLEKFRDIQEEPEPAESRESRSERDVWRENLALRTAPQAVAAVPRPIPAAPAPRAEDSPEAKVLKSSLSEINGTLKARLFDSGMNVAREVAIRDLITALGELEGIRAIALDGIVTQRLVDLAEQRGVEYVAGIKAGNIAKTPERVKVVLPE